MSGGIPIERDPPEGAQVNVIEHPIEMEILAIDLEMHLAAQEDKAVSIRRAGLLCVGRWPR